MEIFINAEDYKLIRKFEEILSKGYYADGRQVTDLHNKVLGTRLASTNCSSCIRQRINALVDAANKFDRVSQKLSEAKKEEEPTTMKEEENKELTEAEKMKEKMAKVRAAKKNK